MTTIKQQTCTAFAGSERIATGSPRQVARAAKAAIDGGDARGVLIFDDATARPVEMDFRGTVQNVLDRLPAESEESAPPETPPAGPAEPTRRPGRPKLGVVGKEVTLLPRHWEWLGTQPGGASVALRKLVEQARKANADKDRIRQTREAAFRFMTALAGDEPGFEEAARSLFAGDAAGFAAHTETWPADVRDHARRLAGGSA